jgi:hypothetical protein
MRAQGTWLSEPVYAHRTHTFFLSFASHTFSTTTVAPLAHSPAYYSATTVACTMGNAITKNYEGSWVFLISPRSIGLSIDR